MRAGQRGFDQGFGDLFVCRTAGQVMAEATYGTIEYAYLNLGTKLIVVLGHTGCGAVDAAINGTTGVARSAQRSFGNA